MKIRMKFKFFLNDFQEKFQYFIRVSYKQKIIWIFTVLFHIILILLIYLESKGFPFLEVNPLYFIGIDSLFLPVLIFLYIIQDYNKIYSILRRENIFVLEEGFSQKNLKDKKISFFENIISVNKDYHKKIIEITVVIDTIIFILSFVFWQFINALFYMNIILQLNLFFSVINNNIRRDHDIEKLIFDIKVKK